ncbi:type IV pilus modification protein PilV [Roseateles asaccharophilus]|uniref:Type IV pilus assembly protein PilV n=1 Tax=Roseateles asaccharophilus TaxID=582607 RepID=A0ABU2A1L1_9BURK|nr:type IV pilus modification protein PilV [Roseateles asaccharophilus]MDR7331073.1 type IV pilus assembly protein PilV [Roseateles asaccharophilus]
MKTSFRHRQRGVLLLEVLIALLIFSLGVLGLVGLQAAAAKQSGHTKYRADATLLANELLGQMRLASNVYATLNTRFKSSGGGGADYLAWRSRVITQLPGADTYPPTVELVELAPLNAIVAGASAPATGLSSSTRVTVTMRWKAPGEPAADPAHNIVLTNEIR